MSEFPMKQDIFGFAFPRTVEPRGNILEAVKKLFQNLFISGSRLIVCNEESRKDYWPKGPMVFCLTRRGKI